MKILVVYNPQAAHRRAEKILPEVEAFFKEIGIDAEFRLTTHKGNGTEIVRDADFEPYDGIVAAGGDGTLFEFVNGYFRNPSQKRIPLGILPIGTGNAIYRDLNPDAVDWREAIRVIALNKLRKVDVGRILTQGENFYFLNIVGLGFVADVNAVAQKLKVFGNVSYTLGVLQQTIFLKSTPMRIELDGQMLERDAIFVEISNTRWTSNFLMAPKAEIDDGKLDVTIANKLGRIRLLKCFPKIFTGEHVHLKEIESIQAKHIRIETDVPKVLTPDGELLGATPIEVDCLHQALEVFWK
ncbi:MAG: diacylglycerol kinase family protein [Candidatus Neomarinimicrobiota bacterium]